MMRSSQRVDPSRPGSVLLGAVLLGLAAGVLAATFLTITGEPGIEEAIRLEQAAEQGHADDELVSRGVQRGAGLFGAYALTGAAFGLLFAVAFLGLGRDRPNAFRRSLVAGGILAGAFTVAPWLKYPPNPPAVGDAATVGDRQRLYVLLIVLALLVLTGAAVVGRRLRAAGLAEPYRVAVVAGAIVMAMLAVFGLLPPPPDPVEVPPNLVWQFRTASLGGNLLLWGVLAVGFGVATATATASPGRR